MAQQERKERYVKLAAPLPNGFMTPSGVHLGKGVKSVPESVAKEMNFRLEGDEDEGFGACKPTDAQRAKAEKLQARRGVVVEASAQDDAAIADLKAKNDAMALELQHLETEKAELAAQKQQLEEEKTALAAEKAELEQAGSSDETPDTSDETPTGKTPAKSKAAAKK